MNGTTTDLALDGQFFVRELQGGTPFATYLTGPNGPLSRRDASGQALRWYVYDGLGSVLGEVDASGNLDATRTYDVYGLDRSSTGTATSKHAFVGNLGHTSEPETGLVYMRARFVDPVVGMFVSQDPGRNGGNWFEYCDDSPVGSVDSTGRLSEVVIARLLEFCDYMESRSAWEGAVVAGRVFVARISGMSEGAAVEYIAGLIAAKATADAGGAVVGATAVRGGDLFGPIGTEVAAAGTVTLVGAVTDIVGGIYMLQGMQMIIGGGIGIGERNLGEQRHRAALHPPLAPQKSGADGRFGSRPYEEFLELRCRARAGGGIR